MMEDFLDIFKFWVDETFKVFECELEAKLEEAKVNFFDMRPERAAEVLTWGLAFACLVLIPCLRVTF